MKIPPFAPPEPSDVVLRTGATVRLRPIQATDLAEHRSAARGPFGREPLLSVPRRPRARRPPHSPRDSSRRTAEPGRARRPRPEPPRGRGRLLRAIPGIRTARRSPSPSRTRCRDRASERACSSGSPRSRAPAASRSSRPRSSAHNRRMIDVFRNCGFETTSSGIEGGVEKIVLAIAADARLRGARRGALGARAASASMQRLFEPRGRRRHRGQPRAREDRRRDLPQPARSGFQGTVVPDQSEAPRRSWAGRCYPRARGRSRARWTSPSSSIPAAGVEAAVDDCVAKGVAGDRRDHGGILARRATEGRRREAALLEKVRGRRHPDGRAQLHGPHQHRPAASG